MNIVEKLEGLGVELNEEAKKAISGDYISIQEHQKKLNKVEVERDALKNDYESAKELLNGFEGKDFDAITKERDEWKAKAEQSEKDYNNKIAKRDYSDAIEKLTSELKFTSNSAKKAFMSDLEAEPLQLRDGKVLGFDDFVKSYKEKDENAFVSEQAENRSQFTSNINTQSAGDNGTDIAKIRAVMGLSNNK